MFKHILVPLDGTELAEAALPAAKYLGMTLGAVIMLVHVVEADAPPTIHGERHLRTPEEAEAYLKEVSSRVASPDTKVLCHVHKAATDNVAATMASHEDELKPDLIVMCIHGPGGIRRIISGDMAQRIVAAGHIPVLLVRPGREQREAPFEIRSILAPLDGKPTHEQGLAVALQLAQVLQARLTLLSVVPTMGTLAGRDATIGRFMPGTTQAILEFAEEDLKSYLTRIAAKVRDAGVPHSLELRHGDAAPAIAEVADSVDSNLIVLATHGRAGTEAFWNNSVAARVHAQTRRPLLLVPAGSGQSTVGSQQ